MSTGVTTFRILFLVFALAATNFAQETETPKPLPAARSIRIRFLPPPLEGAITLGIFEESGKLVRILHQEAAIDDFEVGADALATRWDGKDDDGNDLPVGNYHARGFVAAPVKIEEATTPNESSPEVASVRVKLIANPLENDKRQSLDLTAGFDDENAFLKTADNLPLVTITNTGAETKRAWLIAAHENKSATVFIEDAKGIRQFRITGLDRMMSFDGGKFELK